VVALELEEVLDGQVPKETQDSQDLLDQWVKGDRPDRRGREAPRESLVCRESLARTVYLAMLEKGGHPVSPGNKACREPPEWPDLQDLLGSLARQVSREYLAPLEFRGSLDGQESRVRKVHPGRLDRKVGLACRDHQDCLDSPGREDCLDYRACLDSKEKWDLLDLLGPKATRERKAFLAPRDPLALKDDKGR